MTLIGNLRDLSAAFFLSNGRQPQCIQELLLADDLSDAEAEWCEKFIELWDATEALEAAHPTTYRKAYA